MRVLVTVDFPRVELLDWQRSEEDSFPVWQLLKQTASDDDKDHLMLTDDLNKIVDAAKKYDPEKHVS